VCVCVYGSAMCDFQFQNKSEAHAQGRQLVTASGCNATSTVSSTALLDCLRSLEPGEVQTALPRLRGLMFHDGVRWFPVVDGMSAIINFLDACVVMPRVCDCIQPTDIVCVFDADV